MKAAPVTALFVVFGFAAALSCWSDAAAHGGGHSGGGHSAGFGNHGSHAAGAGLHGSSGRHRLLHGSPGGLRVQVQSSLHAHHFGGSDHMHSPYGLYRSVSRCEQIGWPPHSHHWRSAFDYYGVFDIEPGTRCVEEPHRW